MQIPTIQYTAWTYRTSYEAIVNHLQAKFPDGSYEELLAQDVPRALVSTLCWMHEQDAFYMNRRWLNTYLVLADDRVTGIALTKQLGYRMRPPTAASVAVRGYPQPVKPVAVVIPAGTTVPYLDTFFEFLEDTTIPAFSDYWPNGTTTDIIVVTEGQTKESIFSSDGTAWQQFTLPYENVIEDSVFIEIAGETWEEVPSLIYVEGDTLGRDIFQGDNTDNQEVQLSLLNAIIDANNHDRLTVLVNDVEWAYVPAFTGAGQEFTVFQTADGDTFVRFGTVANGAAPPSGAVIDVLYLISGAQKRYALRYNDNEQPTATFGDDDTGRIPPVGSEIKITCRVGGGVVGNIDIGNLDVTVTGFLNAAPDPDAGINPEATSVRITNYAKGTGGNTREALDHAQFYAPEFAKANQRAVTPGDWEVLASTYFDARYGAPAYASAKLHQEVPESNQVDVALWSRDSTGRLTTAGDSLKVSIGKFLQSRRTTCTYENIVDGVTYYFDVLLAVSLKRNFFTTTVFSQLQQAVIDFFDSALVMPGRDVRINELFRKLNKVEGVYALTIESIIGTEKQELSTIADGVAQEYKFLFQNPFGQEIVPGSLQVKAAGQSASDDENGTVTGDVDTTLTNTISYVTGKVTMNFSTVPVATTVVLAEARYYAKLEWEEDLSAELSGVAILDRVTEYNPIIQRIPIGIGEGQTLDFYLPDYIMPVVPGRCYFIGGYGAPVSSPFGPELFAYDDGEGNIVGDVDPLGINTIDYRTGRVQFKWQTVPYYNAPVAYTGQLDQNADGSRTSFTFQSSAGPPWIPGFQGNIKIDFSGYPGWGAESVMYDNWQGVLLGGYLDNRGDSSFNYTAGLGSLEFATPPQSPGAPPHQFAVSVTSVTVLIYSAYVFSVKAPATVGYDLYLYGDNQGKLWGTTPNDYPFSRLEHLTGHVYAALSSAIASGRVIKFSYDSLLQSDSKNLPVGANAIGTFGRTIIRELEEEIDL